MSSSSLLTTLGLRALASTDPLPPNLAAPFLIFHFVYAYAALTTRGIKRHYSMSCPVLSCPLSAFLSFLFTRLCVCVCVCVCVSREQINVEFDHNSSPREDVDRDGEQMDGEVRKDHLWDSEVGGGACENMVEGYTFFVGGSGVSSFLSFPFPLLSPPHFPLPSQTRIPFT